MKILEFIFRNFWTWAGAMALLYILTNSIVNLINNFMYYRTVRKIGYPPCTEPSGKETIKKDSDEN